MRSCQPRQTFGSFQALVDINLEVAAGERIGVCGPSDSGKATLVRCINQLEPVQGKRILIDGMELGTGGRNVEAIRRDRRHGVPASTFSCT